MKYRVWLKDIALQDIEVEADSERDASLKVNASIKSDELWQHVPKGDFEESQWEVESVEPITNNE